MNSSLVPDKLDNAVVGESVGFEILPMPGNNLELQLMGGSCVKLHFDESVGYMHGMTRYGMLIKQFQNGDVTFNMPENQLEAFVQFFGNQ